MFCATSVSFEAVAGGHFEKKMLHVSGGWLLKQSTNLKTVVLNDTYTYSFIWIFLNKPLD